MDCPGSARAVTEDYFGIDTPGNEGDEEIHTGVLRCGPIQGAWQSNVRPPRWVACSRSSPARLASASVPPRSRSATGANSWKTPCGCAWPSRHRQSGCACRSLMSRPSPRARRSRITQRLRPSRTARRPPPHRPRLPPRLQRPLRLSPRSRRRRKQSRPRFRRRRRLPPRPPRRRRRRRRRSSPAGPSSCGSEVSRPNQSGGLRRSSSRSRSAR